MPSSSFPFTLNFRGRHGKRVFATPLELAAWLSTEIEGYQDFSSTKSAHNIEPMASLAKSFLNLEAAHSGAQKLKNLEIDDSRDFIQTFAALNQQLQVVYHNKGLPPSDSYVVQALRPVLAEEPQAALAALFALSSPSDGSVIAQMTPSSALGVGLASLLRFRVDQDHASTAFSKAADSTIASINLRADETHVRVGEQIRLADEAQKRAHGAWDTHNDDYAKLSASLEQKVDVEIQTAEKEIHDFKAAYRAEIALKEPVKFWEDKGDAHQRRANLYGGIGLVSAGGLATAAAIYLPELLRPATRAVVELSTQSTLSSSSPAAAIAGYGGSGPPSYYGIALAVVLTTLAMWFLRILVRGYFSQTHLATDAEERVAMVKTYLALMESGKAPTDTLNPVLVALFRPASDGLVRDDSMPIGFAEILTKHRG